MARVEIRLGKGESLRVFGPARMRVRSGVLGVLGAELEAGREVVVGRSRSYLVTALEPALVSADIGEPGRIEAPAAGEEPGVEWVGLAEDLLSRCDLPCVVAVVGPVDSGKTSFSALVANRAFARGVLPAIVDADVGQADVGPPGFVSMTLVLDWVLWLRELEPVSMEFIGSVEPGPVQGRVMRGASRLVDRALGEGAGVVVVDTDGWVEGWSALEYKLDLLSAVDADYVVVMGDERLYGSLEAAFPGRVLYARSPSVIAPRDRRERRLLRTENYKRYLDRGIRRSVRVGDVMVRGSCVFSSKPVDDRRVIGLLREQGLDAAYLGRFPGGYCVVVDSESPPDLSAARTVSRILQEEVIVVYTGGFRGVLAALRGDDSDYPAVVESVELDEGVVTVRTSYEGPVRGISFGRIRLDENYSDSHGRRIWI